MTQIYHNTLERLLAEKGRRKDACARIEQLDRFFRARLANRVSDWRVSAIATALDEAGLMKRQSFLNKEAEPYRRLLAAFCVEHGLQQAVTGRKRPGTPLEASISSHPEEHARVQLRALHADWVAPKREVNRLREGMRTLQEPESLERELRQSTVI